MKQTPTTPPLCPVSVRSHSQSPRCDAPALPMRHTRMQRSSEPNVGSRARSATLAGPHGRAAASHWALSA
jgi:hypothetical protein